MRGVKTTKQSRNLTTLDCRALLAMTTKTMALLDKINIPHDLKKIPKDQLPVVANDIRDVIISTVSKTGGHLASSLGAVDLTVALHYVYNSPKDKIIWDVGHQAYAHKILTGRKAQFKSLRNHRGLSGFPKRSESEYDAFGAGHSSTSISAALGFAAARDLKGEKYKVVAVIGDGSMTGGLAFEGLQNAGHLKKDMLVILNDNEMFISQRVGAISEYFAKLLSTARVKKAGEKVIKVISRWQNLVMPFRKLLKRVKVIMFPGMLWEEMGFNYIGPVSGHNIENLITVLSNLKDVKGPVLLHVITKKGKGYAPAEEEPTRFHGVGKFDVATGESSKIEGQTYTSVFSDTLLKLAKTDKRIIAITAAMPEGTGLDKFAKKYPDRYFDVGIAEEHAVTFASGLAAAGLKPIVALYSTFMQRALDNIIHDAALQNLPVVFAVDRAGLVGEDGATHHGAFDFSYLKYIPNIIIMAPSNENELADMLKTALNSNKTCVIRYPRGSGPGVVVDKTPAILNIGKAKVLRHGSDIALLGIGSQVANCVKAADMLKEKDISATVINMCFLKPLDENAVCNVLGKTKKIITVEENSLSGGFGESVKALLCNSGAEVQSIGLPDKFIEHGSLNILKEKYGLTAENIVHTALGMLKK